MKLHATRLSPTPESVAHPELAKTPSLGDRVYETLLSQLISLKIAPGSRMAVDALVRELVVSQTPIRAALIRLEAEGLVVKTHNVGYSAAPMPSRARFEQMYDMRELLEPYMAARAAQNMTELDRLELTQLVASMTRPTNDDAKLAYSKFALQDANFHSWIASHSGNNLTAEAMSRLYAHTHLFRLRFHSHVTKEAIKEHAEIVEALLTGDSDAAGKAMKSHICHSRDRMAPFFELMDVAAH